ncbi:MAG: hypothetical protein HY791_18225 [Deltaproteobacteria bacterium]|nr:hypothetical protein [Deltaproteobacteria bacterium]
MVDLLDACRPRFTSATRGHVESYFLRANHPTERKAFWLKATIFKPLHGPAIAETWAIVFDGADRFAERETVPLESARFRGSPPRIEAAKLEIHVDGDGVAKGSVSGPTGRAEIDLAWTVEAGSLGAPLCLLPLESLLDGPFPKSKLLTPYPSLVFRGQISAPGRTFAIDGWHGMLGHNWGKEHAHEYLWGQCNFLDGSGTAASAEAFTARIKVGPVVSPRISALVVRTRGHEYRFERLYDLWRQKVWTDELYWSLRMRSDVAEASLTMRTSWSEVVCLGYDSPNGKRSFCVNSKLAKSTLELRAPGENRTFVSAHGGAFELLSGTYDARAGRVV